MELCPVSIKMYITGLSNLIVRELDNYRGRNVSFLIIAMRARKK